MYNRDKIEEALYKAFRIFQVPDSVWPALTEDVYFQECAAEDTAQGYRRCAFLAKGAIIMQGDTGKPRSRGSYEKHSARDRYRRLTQFAADAFRVDIVESVHFTLEQQERAEREGMAIDSRHNRFEVRIGVGKSQQVIKRTPDWQAITERWNEANPEDGVGNQENFHTYYNRFIKRLGYVPKGGLSFADLNRIRRSKYVLRSMSELLTDLVRIIDESDDAVYQARMTPFSEMAPVTAADYDRLAKELEDTVLQPKGPRFAQALKKLLGVCGVDPADS